MRLISAYLSDNTTVSLVAEETSEDPESFSNHLMLDGRIVCSFSTWDQAWEEFGLCVRCATLEEVVGVATQCVRLYSTTTAHTNEDDQNERSSRQECSGQVGRR